jgi:hypothetical protein
MIAAILVGPIAKAADPLADGAFPKQQEAWRTSPFHGLVNGAGQPIPCRCRHLGRAYNLGDKVCLQMPNGIVMARCDMFQNNTSWTPTEEACTLSWRPGRNRTTQSFTRKASRQS